MDARARRVLGGRPSRSTAASNESFETSIHEAWELGLDRMDDKLLAGAMASKVLTEAALDAMAPAKEERPCDPGRTIDPSGQWRRGGGSLDEFDPPHPPAQARATPHQ